MKVAIYCRLSDEDKDKLNKNDDSESIQNQKLLLTQYANEHNWEIHRIYSDDDYTGADRNRPEFNELLKDAENKKFQIVLCKSQSRFTREMSMVEKYIHGKFVKWGIRFIGVADSADTANKGNKKARQINGLVNEWYLWDLSDNIKGAFNALKKEGHHIGSFALYGYMKDPNQKGHLIIDPEAAEIVREVFNLFLQGYGKTNIARILNDRGIPNPTEYKRQKGLRYKSSHNKNSTLWRYFSIANTLSNEMYIGNMVQSTQENINPLTGEKRQRPKDEWVIKNNTHEPIIDLDTWNQVQQMIKSRAKPFVDTHKLGVFAKKVKCKQCDYFMRSRKNHGHRYLDCATRYDAKHACEGAFISVSRLEEVVLSELNQIISEYTDKDLISSHVHLNQNLVNRMENIKTQIQQKQKEQEEQTNIMGSLYIDKIKGVIDETTFSQLHDNFSKQIKQVTDNISSLQKQLSDLIEKANSVISKEEIIEKYSHIGKLEREYVLKLIDVIYVSKKNPETKEQEIEILWNF